MNLLFIASPVPYLTIYSDNISKISQISEQEYSVIVSMMGNDTVEISNDIMTYGQVVSYINNLPTITMVGLCNHLNIMNQNYIGVLYSQ